MMSPQNLKKHQLPSKYRPATPEGHVAEVHESLDKHLDDNLLHSDSEKDKKVYYKPRTAFEKTIKKVGDEWYLYNKKGTRILGRHPSREKAVAQEQAIHISQHKSSIQNSIDDLSTHISKLC